MRNIPCMNPETQATVEMMNPRNTTNRSSIRKRFDLCYYGVAQGRF